MKHGKVFLPKEPHASEIRPCCRFMDSTITPCLHNVLFCRKSFKMIKAYCVWNFILQQVTKYSTMSSKHCRNQLFDEMTRCKCECAKAGSSGAIGNDNKKTRLPLYLRVYQSTNELAFNVSTRFGWLIFIYHYNNNNYYHYHCYYYKQRGQRVRINVQTHETQFKLLKKSAILRNISVLVPSVR